MNKIHIIGRLTADPELRTTNSGIQVCTFTVAVNRRFNREEADFIPVVVWRDMAVNSHKYLSKGSQVAISGSVQIRRYDDKDGSKRIAVDIQAEEVEFLTPKSEGNAKSKHKYVEDMPELYDDEMPF